MSFYRFNVLNPDDNQQTDGIDYAILLNVDEMSSIKPINIRFKGDVIHGYWIRMNNGKKYKATRIPQFLKDLIETDDLLTRIVVNKTDVNGNEPAVNEAEFH
ncbi:MAG: hypothetical protein GY909_09865 [Oligoflexia bacterium]|nr:hypothetical protein [Oligoflexia bacterium]